MAVLKEGSSGPAVKALQRRLKDKGFDPGLIDGAFGPGTEAAVIAFQRSERLAPDGIAGPRTLARLAGAPEASDDPLHDVVGAVTQVFSHGHGDYGAAPLHRTGISDSIGTCAG